MRTCIIGRKMKKEVRHEEHLSPDCAALAVTAVPVSYTHLDVYKRQAKGIRTEKGELNRWIKATNRLMQDVRKKIKALFVWMAEVKEELSKPQTPSPADLLIAYYNQRNGG